MLCVHRPVMAHTDMTRCIYAESQKERGLVASERASNVVEGQKGTKIGRERIGN